ncbi:DUF1716-domain-containing protein [Backusella circina FSU 941]|nr:DUF1716-domain-containing protein [Backusella circina FSU 941]
MNIDDIFKIPAIPSGRNKRKMPATPDLQFFDKYKEEQEEAESSSQQASKKKRHVEIETVEEEDDEPYGYPEPDEVDDDDDGGRFFGGGLTDEQSKLLDLVDEYDADEMEALTSTNVKKMILKFEKAINKNQEMRVRYSDQPEKFMESEADLDEEIKNLLSLTEAPHLYPEFVKLGSVSSLLSLLSHENTDIAIDAIDLVNELIDEDVGTSDDIERSEEAQEGMKQFVDSMLENELLQLLVQNLGRMNEEEESDRQGVFKVLGILESIISLDPKHAETIALHTEVLPWLLKRVQKKEFDANIGYTSEIISILLQDSREIRLKMGELEGVDILLQAVARYRRKDAPSEEESEMVENFFNALTSLVNEPENKKRFFDSEGVELMVIMLKERTLARIRAIKVLNYALAGPEGKDLCLKFVDATGLKYLFPLFMGKGSRKLKKSHKSSYNESEDEEHITCIILSLLRNLSQKDVQRMRLLLKFTEDNCEKMDRLVEMKEQYESKDETIKSELEEMSKTLEEEELEEYREDAYIRRLNAGLFTLQRVCLLIASLNEESKEIREKATMLLRRNGRDMLGVFKIIEEEDSLMLDFVQLRRIARNEMDDDKEREMEE